MALYSSPKYREVSRHFFNKFDLKNLGGQNVDINNEPIGQVIFSLRPKETNLQPMFDFVED